MQAAAELEETKATQLPKRIKDESPRISQSR